MKLDKNKIISELSDTPKKNLTGQSTSILCYTIDIKSKIHYELIDKDSNEFANKIFWKKESNDTSFLALGAELVLDDDKYSKEQINNEIIDITKNSLLKNNTKQKILPLFIGGQNFNINQKNINIWESIPTIRYLIPKILLYKSDSSNTITFNVSIESPSPHALAQKIMKYKMKFDRFLNSESISEGIAAKSNISYTSKAEFDAKINNIKNTISKGKLEKVVISNIISYECSNKFSSSKLLRRLQKNNPSCSIFYYNFNNNYKYFGATPELILKKKNNRIKLHALAGSMRKRNNDNERNKQINTMLHNNDKLNHEHDIVIRGIKESLNKFNLIPSVGSKSIMELKNLLHIKTSISAETSKDDDFLDIIDSLCPSAALSGYPKDSSIKKINELEKYDRGWYSGTIGWIDNNLDCEFYAGLRSALSRDKHIYIYSGAGITIDSNINEEWLEINSKMQTIAEIIQ